TEETERYTMRDLMSAEWIDEFSAERYRPMLRLLDNHDFEFLRSQPGVTPRHLARLRAQRRRIFRGYLHYLNADFGRVCMALKQVIAESGEDRPDLAKLLLRHQAQFSWGILRVQVRLVLYTLGLCQVDATALMSLFEGMRQELRSLVPIALGAR